eukprot:CAMPEP_0205946406 /NCGR_PEP_ID=MMETSP1325-20131115/69021_1 /ASSEMBLY_ACC=CAM_ASM_000708 /TAXON_ID=236786 /ORGANISM="Florenciella sp., Strain RCC1007" /LENGTH=121 /DNA_ID=CAMNT_0053317471 /DNA_START=1053 /DNA_END=1414 /DNA_ORIENTATION=-
MAAATPPPTSPESEAQKELLLGMGLPFGTWRSDTPLHDFEGVTVDDGDGLVKDLNFADKTSVASKLADFASLTSLKELNMKSYNATGNIKDLPQSITDLNLEWCKKLEGDIESLKDMPLTS